MIGALQTHAKSRGLAVGAVALAALVARLWTEAPPPRTIEGVASALGAHVGGSVRPDDFLWEERRGFLEEAFFGRRVLFLAAHGDGPRDLYRARVRLSRGGRPLSVSFAVNLTRTPAGDERDLTGSGHHVAYATATPDGVQGITLLDLGGEPPPAGRFERAIVALDRWLEKGAARGLGRTEIAFSEAPSETKHEVAQGALVMSLGSEAVPAALDLTTRSLQTGRANPFGAAAQTVIELNRPTGEVLADALSRALSPAAGVALRTAIARAPVYAPQPPLAPPEGPRIAADYPSDGGWPPLPLTPPSAQPFDGEGYWHVSPKMQAGSEKAPPAMLETIVRPDVNNPDAIVYLAAIDTRRLDVRIIPGTASPRAATGPRGSGLLPRGAAAQSVVAVFGAGPPPSSKPLGFQGEGRLLVPLSPGAPTFAQRPDGRAVLGAWPESASRDAFVAIAQGPDALAESGSVSAGARVGRAALCRTKTGYLVIAYAPAAEAGTLREGLLLSGCIAAQHLGIAPAPLGLAYVSGQAEGESGAAYTGTLAAPFMTLPTGALSSPWPYEIGVITPRSLVPQGSPKGAAWTADTGSQPPPAWLAAVYSAETEHLGAKVKLYAFLPGRATFRLAAGKDETVSIRGEKPGPSDAERKGALAALGISVSKRGQRRGLVLAGQQAARPGTGMVWLVLDGPRLTVGRPGESAPTSGDATEVPLIADERALLPASREVGTQRPRTALCALNDGTVLVAHTSFDTDEANAEVLLDAGCDRVVALDRGAHDGVFVHRGGTDRAPESQYEATTLFVLGAPGAGTAQDF